MSEKFRDLVGGASGKVSDLLRSIPKSFRYPNLCENLKQISWNVVPLQVESSPKCMPTEGQRFIRAEQVSMNLGNAFKCLVNSNQQFQLYIYLLGTFFTEFICSLK